jgi:hypothetical protein
MSQPEPGIGGHEPSAVLPFERTEVPGRLSAAQRNESRIFALSVVRNPKYQKNLLDAAIARTLPPQIELAMLAYAWGKPPDRIEVGTPGSFSSYEDLPVDALADRAEHLARVLRLVPKPSAPQEAERVSAVAQTDAELERLAETERIKSVVVSLVTKEEIGAA